MTTYVELEEKRRTERRIRALEAGGVVLTGTGSPEGVITAPVGAIYAQTDGSAGAVLFIKESGSGNTGWVASSVARWG